MRSPVFNGCGSSPDKTSFKCRSTTFITALRTILSSRETDCTVLTVRPVVYGHFPISSELEPPTPDPLPDPLYCLRDIRQYSTPGKAALSSSFAQYRFMASSILESSTISSIILSSLHMIIKLAFNSPGRLLRKNSYQTPLPCALFFPFSQP